MDFEASEPILMKAMLLAAGSGSRLRPLTNTVPKPLTPIGNVPLLFRTLNWLKEQGVTDVVVNASHLANQIVDAVGDGSQFGLRAKVSVETELLGTSGAVKKCANDFANAAFYVIYGDNLIDANLGNLLAFHKVNSADATIALFTPPDISSCGAVETTPDGQVTRFVEKPKPGETDSVQANAGIYIIEPHLLKTIPNGFSDFGNDIFPSWVAGGVKVFAAELGGYLQDTGTPERYRKANWDILDGILNQSAVGDLLGQSYIGEGCKIDSDVKLEGKNCIGRNCAIGAGASLQNCILWPGAVIGEGCVLYDVIVGEKAYIPPGTVGNSTILV